MQNRKAWLHLFIFKDNHSSVTQSTIGNLYNFLVGPNVLSLEYIYPLHWKSVIDRDYCAPDK